MRVKVKQRGNFDNFNRYTASYKRISSRIDIDEYARKGLYLLRDATPTDTGKTASSWYYKIDRDRKGFTINYYNSNVTQGVPVIILLQYGHATMGGYYVEGQDIINPAISKVFSDLVDEINGRIKRG